MKVQITLHDTMLHIHLYISMEYVCNESFNSNTFMQIFLYHKLQTYFLSRGRCRDDI